MAAFNFYDCFRKDLVNKVHDLFGTDEVIKVALTNTAPNASTHTTLADISEISAGNGYSAGGVDIDNDGVASGANVNINVTDKTITASGGSIGPFRYAVAYNDTSSTNALIGWWDRGSSLTLNSGDAVNLNFAATILQVA